MALVMITIAIIEDNVITLKYLEALLSGSGKLQVVGAYSSGKQALSGIRHKKVVPNVLMADLNLPDISGVEVIRQISEEYKNIKILVLTMHEDREHLLSAIKAGASGYLLKETGPAEIIKAIEEVAEGGAPITPKIARYVIAEFQDVKGAGYDGVQLTPREKDVLKAIATNFSEKDVADNLSLSPHTIHTHIKSIYKKLHVKSKTEAVLKAKTRGLI